MHSTCILSPELLKGRINGEVYTDRLKFTWMMSTLDHNPRKPVSATPAAFVEPLVDWNIPTLTHYIFQHEWMVG